MPPTVVVVGLGPAGPDLLGAGARHLLEGPHPAFLRTAEHPAATAFPELATFDAHYRKHATFEEVYAAIVDDLVAAARRAGRVVYAVPGSPTVAERSVELLLGDGRVVVEVVPAVSFIELAWTRLGVDPVAASVTLADAATFSEAAAKGPGPFLVAQCHSTEALSAVKLAVDEAVGLPPVTVLRHLGLPDEEVVEVPFAELDHLADPDHLTSLYVPKVAGSLGQEVVALDELARRLRRECPWDRQQTHRSLRRHLLEEAYEVLDALDELGEGPGAGEAAGHLEEELGDLMFQVVLHARLGAEEGWFTLADVARQVRAKLVARHPHVFGDVVADTPEAVAANWEVLKAEEKQRRSALDGVGFTLPSLALSNELLGTAERLGVPGPPEPLRRRAAEAAEAAGGGERGLGLLLLAAAAEARASGHDAELSLRSAALGLARQVVEAESHDPRSLGAPPPPG